MEISYLKTIKKGVPEANIQAEFYRLCRNAKIQILLEVTYCGCRFDALIFKNDAPILIVEVKNYSQKRSAKGLNQKTRQMSKYIKFGLPIIGILNSKQIIPAFEKVCFFIDSKTENESC